MAHTAGAAAIAISAVLSVLQGVPDDMPGASLGSPLLLHLECGVALLGIVITAVVVGVRATRGRFPVRIGQLDYSTEESKERDVEVVRAHEERLQAIERLMRIQ